MNDPHITMFVFTSPNSLVDGSSVIPNFFLQIPKNFSHIMMPGTFHGAKILLHLHLCLNTVFVSSELSSVDSHLNLASVSIGLSSASFQPIVLVDKNIFFIASFVLFPGISFLSEIRFPLLRMFGWVWTRVLHSFPNACANTALFNLSNDDK